MPFLNEGGERLVGEYYRSGRFTGPWFDWIPRPSPDDHNFTWGDIAAVSMLGVEIPPRAGVRIVEEERNDFAGLLEQVPTDLSVFDRRAEGHLKSGGPADSVWQKLDGIPGVGWVTANKLLARKRPTLLPVYDQFVKAALQPEEYAYWLPLHMTLAAPQGLDLRRRLEEIHSRSGLDDRVPLLRVLDVAVWMRAYGRAVMSRPPGTEAVVR